MPAALNPPASTTSPPSPPRGTSSHTVSTASPTSTSRSGVASSPSSAIATRAGVTVVVTVEAPTATVKVARDSAA